MIMTGGMNTYILDLASRAAVLGADDKLAAQLGDGEETDDATNQPGCQTNPALFAEPHVLSCVSKGNPYIAEWIPTGRPLTYRHAPALWRPRWNDSGAFQAD